MSLKESAKPESARSSASTPLKSSTEWPPTMKRRARVRNWRASPAAAPKHTAKWNHEVGPEAVCRMVPLWDGSLTGHWR